MSGDTTAPMPPTSGAAPPPGLRPGQGVERYVVVQRIGEGGCGEVVAAFDPMLDRNVALKLLHRRSDADALIREARMLAKLSHPHIVTIHDAGIADGQPFLAMELVRGADLKGWIARDPPPDWRSILARLREAGSGLLAAHARGIVHGDVKPANILVGEERARVTDFGVATWSDRPADEADPGLARLVGTPAYMAPEQYEGRAPDARSDQYAFCQTAWEALVGPAFTDRPSPPHTEAGSGIASGASSRASTSRASRGSGGGWIGLVEAKRAGPPPLPSSSPVPRPVLEALRRGLQPDPEARWPSMEELLVALAHDPARRRRAWIFGGTALALAGAASLATAAWVDRGEAPCRGAEAALGAAGGARIDAVRAALGDGGPAYAEEARTFVVDRLHDYASGWSAMHTASCEATQRGEQSVLALDRRMSCLRRARQSLTATQDVLVEGGAAALQHAHRVVGGLPPLERCADLEALDAEVPPPADPTRAAALEAAQAELAHVTSLSAAGRIDDALQRLQPLLQGAPAIEHPAWTAELQVDHGSLLETAGMYEEALAPLQHALGTALEHGPQAIAIQAAAELAFLLALDLARVEEAQIYGDLAVAMARAGHRDTSLEAMAVTDLAAVAYARGDLRRSEELDETALAIRERALGPEHPTVAEVLENLAGAAAVRGDHAAAEARARRALAIRQKLLGAHHPDVAKARTRLGEVLVFAGGRQAEAEAEFRASLVDLEAAFGSTHPELTWPLEGLCKVLREQGCYEEAEAAARRCMEIREARLGPDHPEVALALTNLAGVYIDAERPGDAEPLLRRALAVQEGALGPEHVDLAATLTNLGAALLELDRPGEARRIFERALAVSDKTLGVDHPESVTTLLNLGQIHLRASRPEQALPFFERCLRIREEALGPDHPDLARPLRLIGDAAEAKGEIEAARRSYARAWQLLQADATSPRDRADVAFALARADWRLGDDRPQARALAEQARQLYAEAGTAFDSDRTSVDAWLAEHR